MNPPPTDCSFLALLPSAGQAAFVAVYALLLVGIIWMPKSLQEVPDTDRLPWKNPRVWAAVICAVQILVYWLLG